jgi:hypothetical protein
VIQRLWRRAMSFALAWRLIGMRKQLLARMKAPEYHTANLGN